jgi:hypothetical protein
MATPAGLCDACSHRHVVTSGRGSVFSRCLLHDRDPRFPKYPRLPVTQCAGFARKAPDGEPGPHGKPERT